MIEANNVTRSAGGIVLNPEGEVLVVSQGGTSWSLPKGHIENGEDEEAAARREIHEESGIRDLVLVRRVGEYVRAKIGPGGLGEDATERKSITLFLFTTTERALRPLDPQNPEARWVRKEAVADLLTHPKDASFYLQAMKEA